MGPGLSLQLSSNPVQVSSPLAGQPSATIGVLLHQLESLQGLESLPGQTAGSPAPVRGRAPIALADAIDLADGGDTDWRPEWYRRIDERRFSLSTALPDVHVTSHGGASDVEPVLVIGGLGSKY